jgi:hypothetical protein
MDTSTDERKKQMSSTYPTITTTEELRSYLTEVSGNEITDADLFWFVCIFNANSIVESYTTKDIAAMLQEGVKPTDKLSQVQEVIDTFYEDDGDRYNQSLPIVAAVFNFCGKYTEETTIRELIGEDE